MKKIPVTTLKEAERLKAEGIMDQESWEEFIDAFLGYAGGWRGFIYADTNKDEE